MQNENAAFVTFAGIKVSDVNYAGVYQLIKETLASNEKGYISATDVSMVITAMQDSLLREAINSSLLSVADGTPLTWYAKSIGCTRIERISGMELMLRLFSEKDHLKHFLLGDTPERIERLIAKARTINAKIQITGYSPPFKQFDHADNEEMLAKLNQAGPDVIWVSFGGVKQIKWMHETIDGLDHGIMIGVGAAFKWILGDLIAPPIFLQKLGFQFFYRVAQELARQTQNPSIVFNHVKKRFMFFFHFFPEVMKSRKERRIKTRFHCHC
jgi:N-acetylglucosaminyldiphosphoundecaprenol N-acetyl-beta-D-mannosaminyltransferase